MPQRRGIGARAEERLTRDVDGVVVVSTTSRVMNERSLFPTWTIPTSRPTHIRQLFGVIRRRVNLDTVGPSGPDYNVESVDYLTILNIRGFFPSVHFVVRSSNRLIETLKILITYNVARTPSSGVVTTSV